MKIKLILDSIKVKSFITEILAGVYDYLKGGSREPESNPSSPGGSCILIHRLFCQTVIECNM